MTLEWPCSAGTQPIPSHRGYLKDQKLLASQGYVTVSISANGINGQDGDVEDGGAQARSSLVRQHLAQWAGWGRPSEHRPGGRARRGEGRPVPRAARRPLARRRGCQPGLLMDSLYPPPAAQDGYRGPVRWRSCGTVIGPTIFGQNPVADVPSTTYSPRSSTATSPTSRARCTSTGRAGRPGHRPAQRRLCGLRPPQLLQHRVDAGQVRGPLLRRLLGRPGTAARPGVLTGARTRLTADQQHQAGATYIAAAARLFVADDDRVRPLLTARLARPLGRPGPRADPRGGRPPHGRLPVRCPGQGDRRQAAPRSTPTRPWDALDPDAAGRSPHFARWWTEKEAGRGAVALELVGAGRADRSRPAAPVSLSGAKSLALRVFSRPRPNTTRTWSWSWPSPTPTAAGPSSARSRSTGCRAPTAPPPPGARAARPAHRGHPRRPRPEARQVP